MDTKLKKLIRLLLILYTLTNVLTICAFAILGSNLNSQYLYVPIYAFIGCGLPGILLTIAFVLDELLYGEIKNTWNFLKKEIILSVYAVITSFCLFLYAYYFID
ncbi:MAG: hypothetical protein V4511_04115 [Bacteroidota bacterium]